MATAATVDLGPTHPPKEESINVFNRLENDLKKTLRSVRHDHDKHEPEYFAAVKGLSDDQLTTFSATNLVEVRVGTSAYGIHLFGKVLLPEAEDDKFFMFRAFVPGEPENAKLHCIHTEEVEGGDGNKTYRAIFSNSDELEWFDT